MVTMKFGHYTNAEGKREELEWNVCSQITTIRNGKVGTLKQLICKHFIDFYEVDEVCALIENNKNIMDIQGAYTNYMFDLAEQELIRKSIDMKDKNVFEYCPFFHLSQGWQISDNIAEYEFYEAGNPNNSGIQLCDFYGNSADIYDRLGISAVVKSDGTGNLKNVTDGRVLMPRRYGLRPTINIFEET